MTADASLEEPPMDEYLRAALRHAPDHALTPPSGVSQAILAAARQLHRPVPPPPQPAPVRAAVPRSVPWRDRVQQLLSPRWAGSLATALVGALVVGLWFDHDLPGATTTSDGPLPSPMESQVPVPPVLPAVAAPAPPTTSQEDAKAEAPLAALHKARPPVAAPAPVPPQPLQEAPPADGASSRRAEAARAPPAETTDDDTRARRESTSGAVAEARRIEPDRPPPAAAASAPGAASPALTLWRRAVAESDARLAIWTWRPVDAPSPRSFDADGRAWLLRLVQAARGRWTDVATASDGGAATEVRWWRDDEMVARLRIETQGLRWLEPSGRIRFAPMDPAALARLRDF